MMKILALSQLINNTYRIWRVDVWILGSCLLLSICHTQELTLMISGVQSIGYYSEIPAPTASTMDIFIIAKSIIISVAQNSGLPSKWSEWCWPLKPTHSLVYASAYRPFVL